jgi:hypothetical protein
MPSIDELPQLTNLSKVFWPEEGYTKLDLCLSKLERVCRDERVD